MHRHPALQISKTRQNIWLKESSEEDFFETITLLSRLYSKRKYDGSTKYRNSSLLEDYTAYVKRKALEAKYPNNVPFRTSYDAPHTVLLEEVPEQTATLEELMDLI